MRRNDQSGRRQAYGGPGWSLRVALPGGIKGAAGMEESCVRYLFHPAYSPAGDAYGPAAKGQRGYTETEENHAPLYHCRRGFPVLDGK